MSKMKYMFGIFVLCIMTIVISVGNSGFCSPKTETDPKDIVIKAYQKLDGLTSYHMTIDTEISTSFQGIIVNRINKNECDVQVKPMILKSVLTTISDNGSKKSEQKLVQYIEKFGDQFIVYTKMNNQWIKQSIPYFNPLNEYKNYFKAIKSVTLIKDMSDCIVYEVNMNGSYLQEQIERLIASTGMKNKMLFENVMKDVGDFQYMVTINKKNLSISKTDMDMSRLMSTIINNMAELKEVPEGEKTIIKELFNNMKVVTTATFSQINSGEKISIPREALNAPLVQSNKESN